MQGAVSQLKILVESSPITEFDFSKNEVFIPKTNHGTEGPKENLHAYDLAMMALSSKLGAAKHIVTRNEDGETDPGNARYSNIQKQFVGKYSKIEDARKYSFAYDFMEVVLMRKMVDP